MTRTIALAPTSFAVLALSLFVAAPGANATSGASLADSSERVPPSVVVEGATRVPLTASQRQAARRRLRRARSTQPAFIARSEAAISGHSRTTATSSGVDSWDFYKAVRGGYTLTNDLWWVGYWAYSTTRGVYYVIWEHWGCLAGFVVGCTYIAPWYWSTYSAGAWQGPYGPYWDTVGPVSGL